jgi:PAS domain S-box-containing protein
MDFLAILNLQAIVFCIIPALLAAYFFYMFRQDKDKRKLIVAFSFSFFACSFVGNIIPLLSFFYFFGNLYAWGTLPIIISVLIILFCEIVQIKIFEKPFKLFLLTFIVTLLIVFTPTNLERAGTLTTDVLAFFALIVSSYLSIRKRQLDNILILLSLFSFLVYGLGLEFDIGFAFLLFSYTFGFLFIGLAFTFTSTNNKWSTISVFRVTEQLDEAHQRLRELELEYKAIFESASDSIFVISAETSLIFDCNFEATKLVEREKQDIVGKDQKILFLGQKNGGDSMPVFVEQAQETSKLIEMQIVTVRGEVKDVAIKWGAFEHSGKKLLVGVFRDITEQKRTAADLTFALESLSCNLEKIQTLNEKLRVVGSLTRHDVRNKLSTVTGYAYLLKKKHADQADIVEALGKMEQAVKETVRIFDFAKAYEQLGVEELVDVDVEKAVNEAAAMFSGLAFKVINDCHGLTVRADSLLRQLIYNFIDNTRKYGHKTTTIRVYFEKADQDSLELIYEDDGVGISAENKLRLFSEGFSTGGSTGFGLFLIRKMVDVYGWQIQEVGEPGKGAKFVLTIPRINQNGKENYQIVP